MIEYDLHGRRVERKVLAPPRGGSARGRPAWSSRPGTSPGAAASKTRGAFRETARLDASRPAFDPRAGRARDRAPDETRNTNQKPVVDDAVPRSVPVSHRDSPRGTVPVAGAPARRNVSVSAARNRTAVRLVAGFVVLRRKEERRRVRRVRRRSSSREERHERSDERRRATLRRSRRRRDEHRFEASNDDVGRLGGEASSPRANNRRETEKPKRFRRRKKKRRRTRTRTRTRSWTSRTTSVTF